MFGVGYRYCNGLARGCNTIGMVGRLAERASIQEAQAEMDVLARQLESTFTETNRGGVLVRRARGIRIEEQERTRRSSRCWRAPPRSCCSSRRPTSPGCCSRAACAAGRRSRSGWRSAPAAAA